jgi:hypothetical protein
MSTPRSDSWWPAALLVLFAGVILTLLYQSYLMEEVFFSGDGGIKALMARQFAEGVWQHDLILSAPPWIQALWDQGLYPFAPPFVYEVQDSHVIGFPLTLSVISAPLYAILGYRGLLVWPLLGCWATWAAFLLVARKLGLALPSTVFGLAGLIFASALTPYAAMFWEHAPAVGLSALGMAWALPAKGSRASLGQMALGGFLLGLSFWLRPESWVFAAAAATILAGVGARLRELGAFAAAAGIPGALFLATNQILYGSPLGLHAVQGGDPAATDVGVFSIAGSLTVSLVEHHPILVPLGLTLLLGWLWRDFRRALGEQAQRTEMAVWAAGLVFCVGTVLILPNDGHKQFGPRYWLHLVPLIWIAAALMTDRVLLSPSVTARRVAFSVLGIALVAGVWGNTLEGRRVLMRDYHARMLPSLYLVQEARVDVVAVTNQWVAQELEAGFDVSPFVRLRSDGDLAQLMRAMADADGTRMLLFGMAATPPQTRTLDNLELTLMPAQPVGQYFASMGTLRVLEEGGATPK